MSDQTAEPTLKDRVKAVLDEWFEAHQNNEEPYYNAITLYDLGELLPEIGNPDEYVYDRVLEAQLLALFPIEGYQVVTSPGWIYPDVVKVV